MLFGCKFLVAPAALLVVALGLSSVPVNAQDDGNADLDEAIELKISATKLRDLDKVAKLCESAIEKGLDEEGEEQARQLWASALYSYAEQAAQRIFDPVNRDRRWRILRQEALKRLKKVIELRPDMADAYILQARLNALPGGDMEAAREAIEKAIETVGNDNRKLSQALFIRATLAEDDEARLADLNQAIKIDPDNIDALRIRGAYYLQNDQADLAIEDFKKWLEHDKENMAAYFVVAQSLMAMQKFDEAIEILNQANEVKPDEPDIYRERARIYLAQEKTDQAIEDLTKAIELDPEDIESLMMRATIYLDEEKHDEALADVNKVLQVQPGLVAAYRLRSFIYSAQENFDDAIRDIQLLVADSPENLGYKLQLAMLLNANDEPSRAIAIYEGLIRDLRQELEAADSEEREAAIKDLLASALRGVGDANLSRGRHAEAIKAYEEALQLRPEDDGILNNLAWVLATSPEDDLRDGKRAIELATKAAELTDYKQAHILSTLASGYAEAGDFETAREWAAKAIEVSDDDEQRENLTKELESYKENKPWRELQNVEEEKAQKSKSDEADNADESEGDHGDDDDGDGNDDDGGPVRAATAASA